MAYVIGTLSLCGLIRCGGRSFENEAVHGVEGRSDGELGGNEVVGDHGEPPGIVVARYLRCAENYAERHALGLSVAWGLLVIGR